MKLRALWVSCVLVLAIAFVSGAAEKAKEKAPAAKDAAAGSVKAEKKADKPAVETKAKRASTGGASEMPSELPVPMLTLGARAGDGVVEGIGDILVPVYLFESGLAFVNPRSVINDHSAEEYNIGAGYRHLIPQRSMIVGANIYYDYRSTERDATFHQLGLGVEYMSDWVDARANYYLPEGGQEKVGEHEVVSVNESVAEQTVWEDPYAVGSTIYQEGLYTKSLVTTTTKQRFFQYEQAMEGFDAELGVKLPIPVIMDYADVKVFGGYYQFNARYGAEDVKGFKGRLEVRAMPSVYVDAEFYEDKELYGSDYYVGARVSLPFDIAQLSQGRNPFQGATEGMKAQKQKTTIASRLTEMVMRDLHVQTERTEMQEEVEKREVSTTVQILGKNDVSETLATDVIFVHGERGDDANPGTYEQPVRTIGTGISNTTYNVFVLPTLVPYNVNVYIDRNVNLMGQGYPIGEGGKYLNGDSSYTVLNGDTEIPGIFIDGDEGAQNVKVRGFHITNTDKTSINPVLFGMGADNVASLEVDHNLFSGQLLGFGAMYGGIPAADLYVHDNVFDTLGAGMGVLAAESTVNVVFEKNTVRNTAVGMVAAALGIGDEPTTMNIGVFDNTILGGGGTTIAHTLGNTNILSFGLPQEIVDALTGAPDGIASIAGIGVAAIHMGGAGAVTLNAEIANNYIEDNLLGIGAAAIGPNAHMGLVIRNNTIVGGGTQVLLDYLANGLGMFDLPQPFEIAGAGIAVVGGYGAEVRNAQIYNNVIENEVVGILGIGFDDARMNLWNISNNEINNSWLGVGVIGLDAVMNGYQIVNNQITGGGLGPLVANVLANIPTNGAPPWGLALLQVKVPDAGVAGVLVMGDGKFTRMSDYNISGNTINKDLAGILVVGEYGAIMDRYAIAGNKINDTLMGIGVLGMDFVSMRDYDIGYNLIDRSLLGVLAGGGGLVDLSGVKIHDNAIRGGGVGQIFEILKPFANTNVIPDEDIVNLLNTPVEDGGAIGVALLGGSMWADNAQINNNYIDDEWVGVLVFGGEVSMQDVQINNNQINNAVVGIGAFSAYDSTMARLSISGNTINDSVMGIMALASEDGGMSGAMFANNVINRSVLGITAAAMYDGKMNNLTVMNNTIVGGAAPPNKLALLTSVMDLLGLTDELEDILGVSWTPGTLPATGLIGLAVGGKDPAVMSCNLNNNRFSENVASIQVRLENNIPTVGIGINNNVGDAPYTVQGGNYILTQSGNVPSPVIQVP